ncbi:MAG: type IX secretion system sortase PorU, partial [Bacteroidia bacterium]
FGLMDPAEGYNAEGYGAMDVGVGRFTCRITDEANAIASKIENYYKKDQGFQIADSNIENCTAANESPYGDWRNWVVFMADDKDAAEHMREANTLATTVQTDHPLLNIDKIYLDAYRRFSTPGGERYPDAAADMNKRIKRGALVFNYTGHGGEVGLTEERVLDVETINGWDNFNKLPLFITATCEFSRYDDPGRTSAGEYCLLNPKGAAIALLTTCRVAFSTTNEVLNTILFEYIFKKLPNGNKPALGDIVRETKANLGQSIYYANFHLLGDPALKLAYPEQKIITTKINTHTVTPSGSDTLSALAKITISGFVADTMGNKLTGFNGLVYPTVFDKIADVTCLLNDPDSYYNTVGVPFSFQLQKNILYRGKTEVKNGDFTFSFLVPKDISFAYGPGKISYYATNGQSDAAGYYQNVIVGGGAKNPVIDNEGPQVNLFLNDKNFVNGGTTNEKPILYANLTDSSGINTLGTGIGHDISVILDQNSTKPVILNDYYEAALNSYQSGRVRYPFDELSEGNHRLTFKAWDIQNNSNVVNTDFVVAPSAELALTHVLNYPNPFTSSTKFFLEHNQACNPLKVTVQIFTISGKVVKTLQRSVMCEGFRPEGIEWDGKDDFGDKLGRGVYIYKVSILNTENKKAEKTEKLVILN